MKRHWKTLVIFAVVAAVALSVVAVALGTSRTQTRRSAAGACRALMSNPEALKAMQDLRAEHQQELQAWADKFGDDPSSAEARAAMQQLRQEHRSDMKALFDKFGVAAPERSGAGRGMMGGGCGGACGGGNGSQGTGYGMMGSGGGMMSGWSY